MTSETTLGPRRLDVAESYEAIFSAVCYRRGERDVVHVVGPGALDYLQGQLSQDLLGLGINDACSALLLSVQGKLDALVRVSRLGEDAYLIDVDEGFGEAVRARLARFKIRVKAELSEAETRPVLEVRGPESSKVVPSDALVALPPLLGRLRGVDLLARDGRAELDQSVPEGHDEAFEAARIELGCPKMGRELDATTIAFEAGIVAETISFTKGCYTGQELIARLDARGARVARHLRGVLFPPGEASLRPVAGDRLVRDGDEVGTLTSIAFSPRTKGLVALAYLARRVEVPATLGLSSATLGRLEGLSVVALPLRSA